MWSHSLGTSRQWSRLVIGVLALCVLLWQLARCTKARSETVTARVPSIPDPGGPGEDLTFTVQVLKPQKLTVRVPSTALPGFGGPQFFRALASKYTMLQGELVHGALVVTEPGNVVAKPPAKKRPKDDCPPVRVSKARTAQQR